MIRPTKVVVSAWLLVFVLGLSVALIHLPNAAQAASDGPSVVMVKAVCLNPKYDVHLDAYVYYKDYLLCNVSDENTNGQALYVSNGKNGFIFLRGSGGAYEANYLAKVAQVPLEIANYLVNSMHAQMQAIQNGVQQPIP